MLTPQATAPLLPKNIHNISTHHINFSIYEHPPSSVFEVPCRRQ